MTVCKCFTICNKQQFVKMCCGPFSQIPDPKYKTHCKVPPFLLCSPLFISKNERKENPKAPTVCLHLENCVNRSPHLDYYNDMTMKFNIVAVASVSGRGALFGLIWFKMCRFVDVRIRIRMAYAALYIYVYMYMNVWSKQDEDTGENGFRCWARWVVYMLIPHNFIIFPIANINISISSTYYLDVCMREEGGEGRRVPCFIGELPELNGPLGFHFDIYKVFGLNKWPIWLKAPTILLGYKLEIQIPKVNDTFL